MQINSIQTLQPSFGTRFRADHSTLDCLTYRPNIRKQMLKLIKEFENNGRNDVLVLTQGAGSGSECKTNALVYRVIPAKTKNGYNRYQQGVTVAFDLYEDSFTKKVISDKEKIARIRNAYNIAYDSMQKDEYWYSRANSEKLKYLI